MHIERVASGRGCQDARELHYINYCEITSSSKSTPGGCNATPEVLTK